MSEQTQIVTLYPGKRVYFKEGAQRPEEFKDQAFGELMDWEGDKGYVRFIRNPGYNAVNVHHWIPLDSFDLSR